MSCKRNILIGAFVGLAISMLKKDDRKAVVDGSKKVAQQVKYIYERPQDTIIQLRNRVNQINNSATKVAEQLDQLEALFNREQKKL